MPIEKHLTKHCAHCSKQMDRKRFNGRLEDFQVFQRRKFCGRECMALAMQKEHPKRKAYGQRARKLALQDRCEACQTTRCLAIHHKDRDWSNNDPKNLQTLCNSCHTSLHHAQGDISPAQPKPPCTHCGKPSYRSGLCSTCRTQIRRYGAPKANTIRRK